MLYIYLKYHQIHTSNVCVAEVDREHLYSPPPPPPPPSPHPLTRFPALCLCLCIQSKIEGLASGGRGAGGSNGGMSKEDLRQYGE